MRERLHWILRQRPDGLFELPRDLIDRLNLDESDSRVEVVEMEDGTLALRGNDPTLSDQAWFWTDQWQQMESQADSDISAGRCASYDSVEEMLKDLEG